MHPPKVRSVAAAEFDRGKKKFLEEKRMITVIGRDVSTKLHCREKAECMGGP
jgi:hypothetical protein